VKNAGDLAVSLEDEFSLAEMLLDKIDGQFDRIVILGGNHWLRLMENISFSMTSKRMLGLVGRKDDPKYSFIEHFDWVMIDNKLRVSHPRKSRKSDYTLARDMSIVHPNEWIAITHRHRVNDGFSPSGLPQFEIGWMGDTERMRYIQHVDGTYYQWLNGFAYYKNGVFHNLNEYNYDWKSLNLDEKQIGKGLKHNKKSI
jgi:hypothetical protein